MKMSPNLVRSTPPIYYIAIDIFHPKGKHPSQFSPLGLAVLEALGLNSYIDRRTHKHTNCLPCFKNYIALFILKPSLVQREFSLKISVLAACVMFPINHDKH